MSLTIALIYPELLGTYGDRGNALVLRHRARARGIDATIIEISPDEDLPQSADIYLLGGGEDSAQTLATDLLSSQKSALSHITTTSLTLAVCAGFQILGSRFPTTENASHPGLDVIDVHTQRGNPRIIGEIVVDTHNDTIGVLTGFENHGGRTTLTGDATPLGTVITGTGNGTDHNGNKADGYFSDHVIGTYLHGPLLARNPILADYLIEKITGNSLEPMDRPDSSELLHSERTR